MHLIHPSWKEREDLPRERKWAQSSFIAELQLSPRNEKQACKNVSVCPVLLPTNNTFLWDLPQVTMKENYRPDLISNKVSGTIPLDFNPLQTGSCVNQKGGGTSLPHKDTPFWLPVGTALPSQLRKQFFLLSSHYLLEECCSDIIQ